MKEVFDISEQDAFSKIYRFLDPEYSYRIARQMEQFRTNEVLGYRTAGSRAEYLTGEMICREMREIGLDVSKDAFTLDGWDFRRARLYFRDGDGREQCAELGSYQTDFHTDGKRPYRLICAGRGTAGEISRLDVCGKLVLVEIDQRGEWWINYPAYQAHLHGAAAVIAVQRDGYGQIHPDSLNAQNISGPADAPAFSLSLTDARRMGILSFGREIDVLFDAESSIIPKAVSYNITGRLEGEEKDNLLLMSAHYDSYFEGFQDDNTAVAMMLCIARAIVKSGYRPRKTMIFCAMAAEEWGVINSRYDWSTGAYNEVFGLHPEWQGMAVLDINLELPAHAHSRSHAVRSVWEYQPFLNRILEQISPKNTVYPEKAHVVSPILTWSDDFSLAIAGIPSLVNDFAEGPFMETHYHSQFDCGDSYDEDVYFYHHQLYARILLEYDRITAAPLDFSVRVRALRDSAGDTPEADILRAAAGRAIPLAERLAGLVRELNCSGRTPPSIPGRCSLNRTLLTIFRFCEDCFVRLTWEDSPIFPHEYAQTNLKLLTDAVERLERQDIPGAISVLSKIDNNAYACSFEREVFDYFTDYAVNQPASRLMWGAGRLMGHVDLFCVLRSLREAQSSGRTDLSGELDVLRQYLEEQSILLASSLRQEAADLDSLTQLLSSALRYFEKNADGNPQP